MSQPLVITNADNMETPTQVLIPARSKREAMDWGLVLASHEIAATISSGDPQWGVLVEEQDFERATAVLKQWQIENRGWRWRHKVPGTELVFQSGSAIWALGIIAIFVWSLQPGIKPAGVMNTQAVLAGQWWRMFTAVTLHADTSHLISNVTAGFLLLGLAMARYGTGIALLTTFLAGAAGNAAALIFYSKAHQGLGASGMVMGALGMLAVSSAVPWRRNRLASQLFVRGVMACFLVLVLVGFSPESDVLAHVGGFLGGALVGILLGRVPQTRLLDTGVNVICAILLSAMVIVSWCLALGAKN